MFRAWICEGCQSPQRILSNIWNCPGCGKEGCDSCFWAYSHCKGCSAGKTYLELRMAANAFFGTDIPADERDHEVAL